MHMIVPMIGTLWKSYVVVVSISSDSRAPKHSVYPISNDGMRGEYESAQVISLLPYKTVCVKKTCNVQVCPERIPDRDRYSNAGSAGYC